MNGISNATRHSIYPARYFDQSQTWFAWNKLTVVDVCNLREEPKFLGQNVFFYNNHPIQYVRLVGLIVDINRIDHAGICLITIDDSSGANIEAKTKQTRLPPDPYRDPQNRRNTYLPTTDTEQLEVEIKLGEPILRVDGKRLEIGSIVRAQGIITTYRGERQIELKRLFQIRDTNEEAEHWKRAAAWKKSVLDVPWTLTQAQRSAGDQKARSEEDKRRKKAVIDEKLARSKDAQKRWKQKEREKRRKEKEAQMNAGALKDSNVLPTPWHD